MHRNHQNAGLKWAGALAAIAFALISQPATASPPSFPGSTVYIPQLATIDNPDPYPSERVMRLPPVAGIVTTVIATNLLKAGPSWIVKGDKYWSLCAPRRTQIACSPITATSTMQDIHIRAYAGVNYAPTVAYDVLPKTTRSAAELVLAMDHFQKRLGLKVAHFARINPNADPKPPKGQVPRLGSAKPLLIAETGTGCVYDDWGNLDCTGGDGGSGGGGGGTDAWEYDWTPDENYEEAAASDPPQPSSIPTFPSGPDAEGAESDPCIGPDGSNVCQQVTITGNRPAVESCVWGLFGRVCVQTPPVVGDPFEPPLPTNQPWFTQDTCNMVNRFCTRGQIPVDNVRTPVAGDTYADWVQACENDREVDDAVCVANHKMGADQRTTADCFSRAMRRYSACLTTARNRAGRTG